MYAHPSSSHLQCKTRVDGLRQVFGYAPIQSKIFISIRIIFQNYWIMNALTFKAQFSPSMADEAIPPAYPAPSPLGNSPSICGC